MPAPESKASARKLKKAERAEKAVDLRKAGLTYSQIAKALGVSTSTAHSLVVSSLEEAIKRGVESADQLRHLELERLDQMLAGISMAVRRGRLTAIDRALRIMERRAKLLGLDAPKQLEHSGPGGGPIEQVDRVEMVIVDPDEE